MKLFVRQWVSYTLVFILLLYVLVPFVRKQAWRGHSVWEEKDWSATSTSEFNGVVRDAFLKWREIQMRYPIFEYSSIPIDPDSKIDQIQHSFSAVEESETDGEERRRRIQAIKEAFWHSWESYKNYGWLYDELMPISGKANDSFCSWATTLVESLDTLWLMGFQKEFATAASTLKKIDFTSCSAVEINVMQATTRHLGGLLGAYDVSNHRYPILLQKAIELGEMLYHAFDTPSHFPITLWKWKAANGTKEQLLANSAYTAELGSLTVEFTKLSMLTGDPKYFDIVQRLMERLESQQLKSNLPGLWPVVVNPEIGDFHSGDTFAMGAMHSSIYGSLVRQHLLLKGQTGLYRDMYRRAIAVVKEYLIFEPFVPPTTKDIPTSVSTSASRLENRPLMLGTIKASGSDNDIILIPQSEHYMCFAGGMLALAAKVFRRDTMSLNAHDDLRLAEQLLSGCLWSYHNTPTGLGPESFLTQPCRRGLDALTSGAVPDWENQRGKCDWDSALRSKNARNSAPPSEKPSLPSSDYFISPGMPWDKVVREGFTDVGDPSHQLRPELVESLFVLYRITGDRQYQEQAWAIFQVLTGLTRTPLAFAEVANVMLEPTPAVNGELHTHLRDSMQSFWAAGTLKYFFLLFEDPSLISLDEYVFNMQGHPLRWQQPFST